MHTSLICQKCHAQIVFQPVPSSNCPACGGNLVSSLNQLTGTVDHRGILLPPRHAVGGIITPR